MTRRWLGRSVALFVVLAASAHPATAASTPSTAPDAVAVYADVERANALFEAGRYADALTLLESQRVRFRAEFDADIVHTFPIIPVMAGRVHAALGRYEEALALFDHVLAETPEDARARTHATDLRDILLAAHFGALRVQCADGITAVRLVGRPEAQPCPARWPYLVAGAWSVIEDARADTPPVTVEVVPGAEAVVTVRRPPPPPPEPPPPEHPAPRTVRFGPSLGVGLSTIGGGSDDVTETNPDVAFRVAATVDVPVGLPLISVVGELGAGWSNLRYHLRTPDESVDLTLSWTTVEGALLVDVCPVLAGMEACFELGPAFAWVIAAREHAFDGSMDARNEATELHLHGRLGISGRIPTGAVHTTVGLRWQRSITAGALVFPDGALPFVRTWLDVGVLF